MHFRVARQVYMLPYWLDESVQLGLILMPLLCVIRSLLISCGAACSHRYHEWREERGDVARSSTSFEDFVGKKSECVAAAALSAHAATRSWPGRAHDNASQAHGPLSAAGIATRSGSATATRRPR